MFLFLSLVFFWISKVVFFVYTYFSLLAWSSFTIIWWLTQIFQHALLTYKGPTKWLRLPLYEQLKNLKHLRYIYCSPAFFAVIVIYFSPTSVLNSTVHYHSYLYSHYLFRGTYIFYIYPFHFSSFFYGIFVLPCAVCRRITLSISFECGSTSDKVSDFIFLLTFFLSALTLCL